MPGRPRRAWPALLGALLFLFAVVLAGCRVTTNVGVRVAANGSGAVTVDVTFDRQASTAVGGVVGQLQTSDLTRAGWAVTGPKLEADGSTVVAVTHPFRTVDQLPGLLAAVATRSGKAAPWLLHVAQAGPASHRTYTATGTVDLTCGLSCFGDAALRKAFGSAVGVNDSAFAGRSGQAAARRDFVFRFTLSLPGRVTGSGTATRRGSSLTWTPVLGSSTALRSTSEIVADPAPASSAPSSASSTVTHASMKSAGTGAAVAVVVIGALGLIVWRWVRRRRKGGDGDKPSGPKHRIKSKV